MLSLILLLPAARPAVSPQRPGQPRIRVADLERRIHEAINQERVSRKLPALQADKKLSEIARTHSADMARRSFFSHVNPDGQDPTARGDSAGYTCQKVYESYFTVGLAENIFQGNLYSRILTRGTEKFYDWNTADKIAGESVTNWMNSPGHRRNILETTYKKTGIGVSISNDDKVFVTQLFC